MHRFALVGDNRAVDSAWYMRAFARRKPALTAVRGWRADAQSGHGASKAGLGLG